MKEVKMTQYCKVGFHGGTGIGMNGIKANYWLPLDNAGIPIIFKSLGNSGAAMDVALLRRASGIPHQVIMRWSDYPGLPDDHPNLDLWPEEAAQIIWHAFTDKLAKAPELHPLLDLIVFEPTNEISTNDTDTTDVGLLPAVYVNRFSIEMANLAMAEGIRVALSGHNAGQPEPHHWRNELAPWLKLASLHPDKLAISLHEGKIGGMSKPILDFYPHLVGRFQEMFYACADLGIARPTTFISEWAWSHHDMPDYPLALDDVKFVAELVAMYPELKGVMLWNLGSGSQWVDLPQKLNGFIPTLTKYVLETKLPDPGPLPTPDPDPGSKPLPAKIHHTIHLLPQNTSRAELMAVSQYLHLTRSAFTYSADVAHAVAYAGTNDSEVIVWNGDRWSDDIFAWFDERQVLTTARSFSEVLPNPTPDPIPPPLPTGKALMGLHASADDFISNEELREFDILQPGVIKVLSFHNPNQVRNLAVQHPDATFIVRAFLAMYEDEKPRHKTPAQFYHETFSDVVRTIEHIGDGHNIVIELHNEPNLVTEGMQGAWANGLEFDGWWVNLLHLYKQALPQYTYCYPGLSPGGSIPNLRQDHWQFAEQSRNAIQMADALAVHVYWANDAPMSGALNILDEYIRRFPHKPIWITEASNNKSAPTDQKAQEYVDFWNECRLRPQVKGVTYFVASSQHAYEHETWVPKQIAKRVKDRMK
jgi:hypothetical protein